MKAPRGNSAVSTRETCLVGALLLAALWTGTCDAQTTTTLGSSDARRCFEESRLVLSEQGIAYCDAAIHRGDLTRRDLAATYSNRGIIYANNGKFSRALEDHNKAIELVPKLAEAYVNRGNVYYHTRDYEKALADYQQAIEFDAFPIQTPYYNKALTLIKLKRKEEARQTLEEALEVVPGSPKIVRKLAELDDL